MRPRVRRASRPPLRPDARQCPWRCSQSIFAWPERPGHAATRLGASDSLLLVKSRAQAVPRRNTPASDATMINVLVIRPPPGARLGRAGAIVEAPIIGQEN